MSTPTSYDLTYDLDICKSGPCGTGNCLGVLYFNTRPQNFCEDVTLQKDCTINGNLSVTPAQITVGGQTFTPKTVVGLNGTFICLAV